MLIPLLRLAVRQQEMALLNLAGGGVDLPPAGEELSIDEYLARLDDLLTKKLDIIATLRSQVVAVFSPPSASIHAPSGVVR